MKKNYLVLAVVSISLLASVVNAQTEKVPMSLAGENFLGTLKDGVYKNEFFGFRLDVPKHLFLLTRDEVNFAKDLGSKALSQNISRNQAAWEKAATAEVVIVALTDKSPGSASTSTLAIGVLRQPDGASSRMVTNVSKEFLLQNPSFRVVEDTHSVKLGGKEFSLVRLSANLNGIAINFDYYATIQNGHSVTVVISYLSDDARKEFEKVLKTLTFTL